MFIDSRNTTAVCDEATERVSDDEIAAARLTTCNFVARQVAAGQILPEDQGSAALELLMALGIAPGQESDDSFRTSLSVTAPRSANLRGAHLS